MLRVPGLTCLGHFVSVSLSPVASVFRQLDDTASAVTHLLFAALLFCSCRVCCGAGAAVACNVQLRDIDIHCKRQRCPLLEGITTGLLLWGLLPTPSQTPYLRLSVRSVPKPQHQSSRAWSTHFHDTELSAQQSSAQAMLHSGMWVAQPPFRPLFTPVSVC